MHWKALLTMSSRHMMACMVSVLTTDVSSLSASLLSPCPASKEDEEVEETASKGSTPSGSAGGGGGGGAGATCCFLRRRNPRSRSR